MTSDTFASLNLAGVYAGGNQERESPVKIVEAGQYPGYIFTKRATATSAYLFNRGDYSDNAYMPTGILDLKSGHVLDVVYDLNDWVEYFAIGKETEVWVYCLAATPAPSYVEGAIIVASSTDGYGMIFSYAADYSYTISPLCKIGKVTEYKAGSTTNNKLVRVLLSG